MAPECPSCGERFDSDHGVMTHHVYKHPDSRPERFWYHVDIGDRDECWEWLGKTDTGGYGVFSDRSRPRKAHRVAYEIALCEPEDYVLHRCDNRPCCNPSHLYEGDQSDNMKDMYERNDPGRRGEDATNVKLSEEDVVEIRERYAESPVCQTELAREFGTTQPNIGRIVRGESWMGAPGPIKGEDY